MKLTDVSDEKIQELIELLAGVPAKEIKRNVEKDSVECSIVVEIFFENKEEEIPITEAISFNKYTLQNTERPVTASDIKLHKQWLAANWCHPWFDDNPLFDDNPFLD